MSDAAILIVEDEFIVAADLRSRLLRMGYRVAGTCASGEDALPLADRLRPDLVLMDIRLAGALDGVDTACRLRHDLNLPVVFLTAYSEDATLQRAKSAEPFGYVLKPFDDRDLEISVMFALHQHRTALSLQEREENYRTLFETVPHGVVYQDLDGRITAVNPAAEHILGRARDELCNRGTEALDWPACRTDGTPFPHDEHPALRALGTGQPAGGVVAGVFNPRLGQHVWIALDAIPLYRLGRLAGVYSFFQDVTAQRAAEQAVRESEFKYRLLADHSMDWIFWLDPDGRFRYCSPSCLPLTGHAAEAFTADPRLFDRLLHEDDRPTWLAHRARCGHDDPGELELRIRHPDGTVKWIAHRCRPLFDAAGAFLGNRGSNRDITAWKELDRELRAHREHLETLVAERTRELSQAKDAAETANRAKSAFLANISHEIRTPMNAIIGLAHLAERGTDDAGLIARLRKIGEAGQQLLGTISDVLDFSQLEAGQLAVSPSEFAVAEVVDEICRLARAAAAGKDLAVRADVAPELSARVTADAGRLRQVLSNLVGNSIKFTEQGQVVLRAGIERQTADSLHVRFEVQDTGSGLTEEQRARLFQPFEPGDATTTRRHRGTGLGLAISQRLVALLGGTLEFESVPRQGSRFWFSVELCKAAMPLEGGDRDGAGRLAPARQGATAGTGTERLSRLAGPLATALRDGASPAGVVAPGEQSTAESAVPTPAPVAPAAPQPANAPAPTDSIERLAALLAEDNIEARGVFAATAPTLQRMLGPRYAAMAQQIDAFEFAAALHELRAAGLSEAPLSGTLGCECDPPPPVRAP